MRLSVFAKNLAILPLVIFFFSKTYAADIADAPETTVAKAPSVVSDQLSSYLKLPECLKLKDGVESIYTGKIQNKVTQFSSHLGSCGAQEQMSALKKAIATYAEKSAQCKERNQEAGRDCIEQCSKNIQNMMSASQVILAGLSQSSVVDSCSKMGQILKLAQYGMTAFTVACGASKAYCDSACGGAVDALNRAQKIKDGIRITSEAPECSQLAAGLETDKEDLKKLIEADLEAGTTNTVAAKSKECTGYLPNLAAAGLGVVSAIKQGQQADACEEASKDESLANQDPCSIATNANTPACICKANPRSPGCALAADVSNTSGGFSSADGKGAAVVSVGTGSSLGTDVSGVNTTSAASTSGTGATLGGGGGGGANLGTGATGSADGKAVGNIVTKTNTGIYSGEGGGGGGAFGSRGSSAQAVIPGLREKIVAEREIASLKSQVSSPGGASNFDKVKNRYIQEKTNLLGQ